MTPECRLKISNAYQEITDFAEHEIRALCGRGSHEAKSMALGIWRFWYHITCGYQTDGDAERLEAIFHNGSPFDHSPSEN
jgi:hypothetical protein